MKVRKSLQLSLQDKFNTVIVEFGDKFALEGSPDGSVSARLSPQSAGAYPEPELAAGDLVLLHFYNGVIRSFGIVRHVEFAEGFFRVRFDLTPCSEEQQLMVDRHLGVVLHDRARRAAARPMRACQKAKRFDGNWQVLHQREAKPIHQQLKQLRWQHLESAEQLAAAYREKYMTTLRLIEGEVGRISDAGRKRLRRAMWSNVQKSWPRNATLLTSVGADRKLTTPAD